MTHRWTFIVTFGALLAVLATAGQSQATQSYAASRRTAAAEAKVVQDADWGIVRTEPATLKLARTAPNTLLSGIKLTSAEWASMAAIKKQYTLDLNELGNDELVLAAAGRQDPDFVARIDARRRRLRADLRDVLTSVNQLRLDQRVLQRL